MKTIGCVMMISLASVGTSSADVLSFANSTKETVSIWLKEPASDTYKTPPTILKPGAKANIQVATADGVYVVIRYPNGFDDHAGYVYPDPAASERRIDIRTVPRQVRREVVMEAQEFIGSDGKTYRREITSPVLEWTTEGTNRYVGLKLKTGREEQDAATAAPAN
jgi:hypothetical protein